MNKKYNLKVSNTIDSIEKSNWDLCNKYGNLFTSYNFLKLLESSYSVSKKSGWSPYYFTWSIGSDVQACLAAYIKDHSQGEFVFDHSWANVYHRLGLNYYPKLLIASPFTPITGKRFLVADINNKELKSIILNDIKDFCLKRNLSGIHINFIDTDEKQFFQENNFIIRYGEQFHFQNNNYSSFEDFLGELSYKKRKAIIKERNQIKKMGINIKLLRGEDINQNILQELYQLYLSTINKKWSYDYLTENFFLNLKKYLKKNIIIIAALENSNIIALALNFISNNNLYGRYWGTKKEVPFLHFEVCYYKAIEAAIELKLDKVEAGAQGPHKIKRGYVPILTYSAHFIFNNELQKIFCKYNDLEKENVTEDINILKKDYSPFKIPPK